MANKIVILSNDIVSVLTPNVTYNSKPAANTTVEASAYGAYVGLNHSGASVRKGTGSMVAKLYNHAGTLVKEYKVSGQIGTTFNPEDGYAYTTQTWGIVITAANDEVGTEFESAGYKSWAQNVSPTSFSTGKIVLEYSGGVPDGGRASTEGSLNLLAGGNINYLQVQIQGKDAGHFSIEVNFSVVAI